eukprot:IDg20268t1
MYPFVGLSCLRYSYEVAVSEEKSRTSPSTSTCAEEDYERALAHELQVHAGPFNFAEEIAAILLESR